MNPLELFDGRKPFKRIYPQLLTSRKFIPKGMDNLDKYLKAEKKPKYEEFKAVTKNFVACDE